MKRYSIVFLQAAVVLTGVIAVAIMIHLPLTEGRAGHLDLLSIYSDPFILYGYVASSAFFIALYKAFKLLHYTGQSKVLSLTAMSFVSDVAAAAVTVLEHILQNGMRIQSENKQSRVQLLN